MLYGAGGAPTPTLGGIFLAALYGFLLIPIELSSVVNFLPGWGSSFPINPPLWSLRAEWAVNLIYGLILFRAKAALLGLIFLTLSTYYVCNVYQVFGNRPLVPGMLFPDLARAGIGFIAGVLIFRAQVAGFVARLPSIAPTILFSVWFLLCAVQVDTPRPIYELTTMILGAPVIVALLVRGERSMPGWVKWFGRLSYPLYASHFAIAMLAQLYFTADGYHSILWTIPMLLAALILAAGIDLLVNSRWLQRAQGAGLFWRSASS